QNNCPIPEETRIWMEDAFIWQIKKFGEEKILGIKTLLPIKEDFLLQSNNNEHAAYEVLSIVAKQMDVNPDVIKMDFYTEELLELKGDMGFTLFGQQYEDESYSSGLYKGKDSDGKYSISIETGQLKELEKLVATIAHEIAHIKILGEGLLKDNDEYLTDLVTVFFGLGIFSANTAFKFYSQTDRWAYSKQGYLSQQEWGYALALYAYI